MFQKFFQKRHLLFSLFASAVLLMTLSACEVEEEASQNGDSGAPVGDGSGDLGGSGGEVDTSDISAFTVRATSEDADYTIYLSKDGDGETPCRPTDDEREITCEINIEEFDLYHHGLSFTVLSPQSQCDYVQYLPYYFSVAPVGIQPTAVAYALAGDGSLEDPATNFPTNPPGNPGGTADIYYLMNGAWVAHASLYGSAALEEDDLRCPWDYRDVVEDGVNCCTSSYAKYVDNDGEITAGDATDWGGLTGACYRGVGASNDYTAVDAFDMPLVDTNFVPDEGFSKEYVFSAPSGRDIKEVVHIANWHSSTTFASFPVPLKLGNPYYIFQCVDHNNEVQYKINIQVREWNTAGELLKYASGNSEVGGSEDDPFGDYSNNDFSSWVDIDEAVAGYSLSEFGFTPASVRDYIAYVDETNDTTTTWAGFLTLGVTFDGIEIDLDVDP